MIATSAAAELRTEIRALDLVKLLHFAPGFIAHRAGNVDLESHDRHTETLFTTESQRKREKETSL